MQGANVKMRNRNMAVSDTKSKVVVALTVPINGSPDMLSPAMPKAAAGGGYISVVQRTKFDAGKINALVESMRASSPTTKSHDSDGHRAWILKHPSALSMFKEIIDASKGKQIVMFLDYDGTLSPIVEDPDRAFMTNEMRQAVRDVSKYFPTAIVSGRCRTKVFNFVRLEEVYYAGSHGMDIKGPEKGPQFRHGNQAILCQPAIDFLPMIDEVFKALVEKAKCIPGAKVENNKFCLSVHFRCVEEKRWPELADRVGSILKEYPKLRLTQGRKVLEIRPNIKWDKGNALEFLLESLGYANSNDVFPIYIGDDRTDEDAFKVLRNSRQGYGILVSRPPKETNASYTLQEPYEASYVLLKTFGGMEKLDANKVRRLQGYCPDQIDY